MPIIRSEESYRPLNGEKVTVNLDIWRFNFGWIKKTRVVSTDGLQSSEDGELMESSLVRVAGDPLEYSETTYMEGLPSSIECPGLVEADGNCVLSSYAKVGTIRRISPMINLSGKAPQMFCMGEVDYGVVENKGYQAKISKDTEPAPPPAGLIMDMVKINSNGVSTVTIASG